MGGAAGCSAPQAPTQPKEPRFLDARKLNFAGVWVGTGTNLWADGARGTTRMTLDITEPVNLAFTIDRTSEVSRETELVEGEPGTKVVREDMLGTVRPDGSLLMVEITDDSIVEGWFTDAETLQLVVSEPGQHAAVVNLTLKPQP